MPIAFSDELASGIVMDRPSLFQLRSRVFLADLARDSKPKSKTSKVLRLGLLRILLLFLNTIQPFLAPNKDLVPNQCQRGIDAVIDRVGPQNPGDVVF